MDKGEKFKHKLDFKKNCSFVQVAISFIKLLHKTVYGNTIRKQS